MKEGTFVKLTYTGKLSDGRIFDTTDPEVGKTIGHKAEPITICLGQQQLLPGLDEKLIGKEKGKHTIILEAKEAFGEKSTKKLELVPKNQLQKQNINPKPGMQLEIDGQHGVVRSISGGRVVVDFNHPLAGQKIQYDINLLETVDDVTKQIESIIDIIKAPYTKIEVKETKATIFVPQLYPQEIMDALNKKITELTTIEQVSFEQGKKENI